MFEVFTLSPVLPMVFLFTMVDDFLFIRYQIMLKCWEENPSDRPTFTKLKDTMKEMERNHRVSMGNQMVASEYSVLFHLTILNEKLRSSVFFSFLFFIF